MGDQCEISVNVVKFSLTFAMHWDIRQATDESSFNVSRFGYTFAVAVLLFLAVINTLASLPTFLLAEIRLTNCGVFQILYCCTGLLTLIGMQFRMLTMLTFDNLLRTYAYRYFACNIIPVLVILMADSCMWLSALLAIEFVLLECFELNAHRTRRFSLIAFLITSVLVIGSHLHEIIARYPQPDPMQPDSYSCKFIYPLPLDLIDKILRVCHVIIPCTIHFVSSIAILTSITRRILLVRDRTDFWRVFFLECVKRKHFFVPPFCFILFNLPHLILHLKDVCEDARDISILRLHVSLNILVYLPSALTFFIYIYPSKRYMHKFRSTFFGRLYKRVVRRRDPKKKPSVWFTQLRMILQKTLPPIHNTSSC